MLFWHLVYRRIQGAFAVISPCVKYERFIEASQYHAMSVRYKESIAPQKCLNSEENKQSSVNEQIDLVFHRGIETTRQNVGWSCGHVFEFQCNRPPVVSLMYIYIYKEREDCL